MSDSALREHLIWLLDGGNAHISFEAATADIAYIHQGSRVAGLDHTPWQLLEHLRICQWDILEFSRFANHVSPAFPTGYWPASEAPKDEQAWQGSVDQFLADLTSLRAMVEDTSLNLTQPFAWGEGQCLLCEVLLVADHNAYHIGQLVLIRKAIGAWNG